MSYHKSSSNYFACPECSDTTEEQLGENTRKCPSCDFNEANGIWVDIYDETHEQQIDAFEAKRLAESFGKYEKRRV